MLVNYFNLLIKLCAAFLGEFDWLIDDMIAIPSAPLLITKFTFDIDIPPIPTIGMVISAFHIFLISLGPCTFLVSVFVL